MDKLDHPEINTSELTAEVRKAMARQAIKRHTLPTDTSAAKSTSPGAGTRSSEKDNSTPAKPLSTDMNSASLNAHLSSLPKAPRLEPRPVFESSPDDEYHLNDLLKFHDADFLNAAYRAILKREPDSFGYEHYLEQLRGGHLDKVDVLAILRFSPEGELQNVRIKGLALPTFIRRLSNLPIIGYPIRLGIDLLRLPVLFHRMRQYEAYSLAQNREAAEHANDVAEHVDSVNNILAAYLSDLSVAVATLTNRAELQADQQAQMKQQLETLLEQQQNIVFELRAQMDEDRGTAQRLIHAQQSLVESSTNDTRSKIAELESSARARISQLESSIRTKISAAEADFGAVRDKLQSSTSTTAAEVEKLYHQLQHARTELALQGRRMALILEEARSRLPAPFDQRQLEIIAAEERHKLDALYAGLEDNFRGGHEEIKERFRAYLPHIKSLFITDDKPIVDLGCGRGEWLELLKEESYRALGVDNNLVLLDRCRARGLEVIDSDALQYLRGLPDNSLSAITGFHIIEHLQIDVLMSLLDEIIRVLRPGGLVIFETPNPENVLVGSNYFYFDPTHRNPLPSLLMKFLLEARGLHRIEVMNLHAWDQARISGKNPLTARFNELFYGPMDYAIAGWKVSE
ncbi:MAG: methyltransferase domain-containing protein [bacterium]